MVPPLTNLKSWSALEGRPAAVEVGRSCARGVLRVDRAQEVKSAQGRLAKEAKQSNRISSDWQGFREGILVVRH